MNDSFLSPWRKRDARRPGHSASLLTHLFGPLYQLSITLNINIMSNLKMTSTTLCPLRQLRWKDGGTACLHLLTNLGMIVEGAVVLALPRHSFTLLSLSLLILQ